MKLIVIPGMEEVVLEVLTTGKEVKEFFLPKENIHYWYPFNINFSYKYTDSKKFLYLVKDKNYEGENYYFVDILKRTRALPKKDGIMFHEAVFDRNMYIMFKAANLGIPTLLDEFTMEDVEEGFKKVGDIINAIKSQAKQRYIAETGEVFTTQEVTSEEWDRDVYEYLSDLEAETLVAVGEMYSMLNVMRKLVEER
jgi:hypothetical protein